MAQFILEYGIDFSKEYAGVFSAFQYGRTKCARRLIQEFEADCNAVDADGVSLLDLTISFDRLESFKMLMEQAEQELKDQEAENEEEEEEPKKPEPKGKAKPAPKAAAKQSAPAVKGKGKAPVNKKR